MLNNNNENVCNQSLIKIGTDDVAILTLAGATDTSQVLESDQVEAGKGGEGGAIQISNADFIAAVFPALPERAYAAVCTKSGNPEEGGWSAHRADLLGAALTCDDNNYIGCSSFYPGTDGSFKAVKGQFAACHFLMLDDVGTKVLHEALAGLPLSWLVETSPGNYQGGIVFAEPVTEGAVAVRLLDALIAKGLCDKGSTGPLSRWARLPAAINGKPKYANEAGEAFRCRLVEWRPDLRYTPEEIVERLDLVLAPAGRPKKDTKRAIASSHADDVLTPKAEENPVVRALKGRGLYKTPLGSGKHDITCPWVHEHTDSLDNGSAYFEPDDLHPVGGYCCQHAHRDKYRINELLGELGVSGTQARHQPVIRLHGGSLHRVIDVAEQQLAARGRHYQAGRLIVSVSTDPVTGDPSIVPTNAQALTLALSEAALWEKRDGRHDNWVPTDPPARHVGILYDAQSFHHLQPLAGVARQPYFREADGELVMLPGYDEVSQRFGVFDPRQFVTSEPTREAAIEALALLDELLDEFCFVAPADKAAALAAIFTAVVRPTLPHAPGFHVRAPVMGSGKTYLCELIGAFAGPGGNAKVSYPTTPEEATKVMLALLLTGPAVIEFDDMGTDWIPHGVINRMLTAEWITDRILGVSRTATVSTRTLFLGSGNNVGPVRDLLRRVVTINLDPRCATPATMSYRGSPVERVRKNRGAYVGAVLTIIRAWHAAGSPRSEVDSVATFGGAWSDYCRHPLMWLGLADPATGLLEQIRHDPDADAILGLMREWQAAFGSTPTTVRKAVTKAEFENGADLRDAMCEFPVEERGAINRSKLGWILKKQANRIVGGFEFKEATADGRKAWCVVAVNPPPSPASPQLPPPIAESPAPAVDAVDLDDDLDFEVF